MALEVNGTRLYAETVGEGTPTLCLHGGPGTDSSGLVRALAPLAQPLGLRLVFYDHRGHGRSRWEPVEQCTQHQLVADIEGVRRALGVDTVHVLGISWGGFLGLMYAARYPRSLRTLIVVGASASEAFMARAETTLGARRRPRSGPPIVPSGTARFPTTTAFGARSKPSALSTSSTSGSRPRASWRGQTRVTASPYVISSSVTSTRRTTAAGSCHASPARLSSPSDDMTGSVPSTRPRRFTRSCLSPSSRSSSSVGTRLTSRNARRSSNASGASSDAREQRCS